MILTLSHIVLHPCFLPWAPTTLVFFLFNVHTQLCALCSWSFALLPLFHDLDLSSNASSGKPFLHKLSSNVVSFNPLTGHCFIYSHLFYFLHGTWLCLEFIHSFTMYLLYTLYMLGIVLRTWDLSMNKKDKRESLFL